MESDNGGEGPSTMQQAYPGLRAIEMTEIIPRIQPQIEVEKKAEVDTDHNKLKRIADIEDMYQELRRTIEMPNQAKQTGESNMPNPVVLNPTTVQARSRIPIDLN